MTTPNIQIDPALKNLLPPLTHDERCDLEKACLADPQHKDMPPIYVWDQGEKSTVLDGHNQFELRTKNHLEIRFAKRTFEDKSEAMQFAADIQFARRNLTESQRAMVYAKLPRQSGPGKPSAKSVNLPIKELATRAKVSEKTLRLAGSVVDKGAATVADAVLNGEFKVSDAANIVALPEAEQNQIVEPAKNSGLTLAKAKATFAKPRSRAGKEIAPAKFKKEAMATFGKLIRALAKLGIQDSCEEYLMEIKKQIKEAGSAEFNAPF